MTRSECLANMTKFHSNWSIDQDFLAQISPFASQNPSKWSVLIPFVGQLNKHEWLLLLLLVGKCLLIFFSTIIIYRLISVDTHLLLVIKVITVNPQSLWFDMWYSHRPQGRNPQPFPTPASQQLRNHLSFLQLASDQQQHSCHTPDLVQAMAPGWRAFCCRKYTMGNSLHFLW